MAVPLLDLKQQNLAMHGELATAFDRVLRSGQYIMGAELEAFERAVTPLGGAPFALGVSSGTDALLLALMALGIGPGDEVVVPSFTFFATGGCVSRVGATPVFADVCPICFNLDVQDAERRLSPRTKAIMPVHLFGQAAEMDGLMGLARKHGLAVIEDGAQALGAEYRGQRVGGFGDFATYSFFPSKNLGALGDAGLLVARDEALAEKARLLRVHGAKPKYYHHLIGANFRMDPLQAALLAVKLPHYEEYTRCRQANAADYTARLEGMDGVEVVNPAECSCRGAEVGMAKARLVLPAAYPHVKHIWNQYTLRVPGKGRRDALREHLSMRGIGSEIYYPVPLHAQPCFAAGRVDRGAWPISDQLASEVVSIPIFPELTGLQREEVVSVIAEFLASGG
jgi:dTDP-4-amino-4,6-dideoxygalactose transaminase